MNENENTITISLIPLNDGSIKVYLEDMLSDKPKIIIISSEVVMELVCKILEYQARTS